MASLVQFKISAKRKIDAAFILLQSKSKLPAETAYLCMIAMECALKCKLLARNSFRRSDEIKENHHAYELFNGKKGHNIALLAEKAGFSLPHNRKEVKRILNASRPYSLRYATEEISLKDCQEEYKYAKDIVDKLEVER